MNYGSSWCAHCHELFPHFYKLADQVKHVAEGPLHVVAPDPSHVGKVDRLGRWDAACMQHPEHMFVVAQVDSMKDALQGIRYTPTFAVFRKGRKVDQFFGPSAQQLRDRVWLHSETGKAA